MNCKQILEQKVKQIDEYLEQYLPSEKEYPSIIFEAMCYSVFAGGKRLRPVLLFSACEALDGDIKKAIPFACAIEMIHSYSLIHDDLPAMDNDDYRRGMLTSHKKFGEAIAILAGDGLLHHAFEIMSDACVKYCSNETAKAMQAIAHGAGVFGMLSGQVADVISEGKQIDEKTMYFIHKNKNLNNNNKKPKQKNKNKNKKTKTNKQTNKKEQQSFRHQNKSSHELTCGEIVGRNTENTERIENLV